MADVMRSFLAGHAAAQQENEQEQQAEQRKLQSMIYKHEISRLKVQDAMEEFNAKTAAASGRFNAAEGQPAPPSRTVPQAPEGSLAPGVGMPNAAGPEELSGRPDAVNFPGLPPEIGGGSPAYTRQPRTLEELIHDQITMELLKPQKLGPGENLTIPALGTKPIASGGRKLMGVPRGGVIDEASGEQVVAGQPYQPRANNSRTVDRLVNGKPTTLLFDPESKKFTDADGNPLPKGTKIAPIPRATGAADDRARENQLWRQYQAETGQQTRAHTEALRTYQKSLDTAYNGVDTVTGKPIEEPPALNLQTFEEFKADHEADASGGTSGGGRGAAAPAQVKQPTNPLQATDPEGGITYTFPTKQQADEYRRRKGIK